MDGPPGLVPVCPPFPSGLRWRVSGRAEMPTQSRGDEGPDGLV